MAIVITNCESRPVVSKRIGSSQFEAFAIGVGQSGVERNRVISTAAADRIDEINVTVIHADKPDKFSVERVLSGQAYVRRVDADVRGRSREIAGSVADNCKATRHSPSRRK